MQEGRREWRGRGFLRRHVQRCGPAVRRLFALRVRGELTTGHYKHKAHWRYDERDVRQAGRLYTEFPLDFSDLVELQLPAYRVTAEWDRDPEAFDRVNWRRQLVSARSEAAKGVHDVHRQLSLQPPPCQVTMPVWISPQTVTKRFCERAMQPPFSPRSGRWASVLLPPGCGPCPKWRRHWTH
jgi:hypothetical protein